MTLEAFLKRQEQWSSQQFGHGTRTAGLIEHITKELQEIREAPHDLEEWVDVIMLALDGFWRHGGDPATIMAHLEEKAQKNFRRKWTNIADDRASQHVRQPGIDALAYYSTLEGRFSQWKRRIDLAVTIDSDAPFVVSQLKVQCAYQVWVKFCDATTAGPLPRAWPVGVRKLTPPIAFEAGSTIHMQAWLSEELRRLGHKRPLVKIQLHGLKANRA